MKKIILSATILASTLWAVSCNQKTTKEENTEVTQEVAPTEAGTATYSYDSSATSILFTAYKYTERAGVGGKFTDFSITAGNETAATPEELLTGATFSIPVSSIKTGDASRDHKIKEFFFGTLNATDVLKGSIKEIKEGKVIVDLTMNSVSKEISLDYSIDAQNVLRLKGNLDVSIFDALPGIEKLNEICHDLHTGSDNISKLWPDVDITIKSTLMRN
ncbi:YceI family protein [Algivirga pacifica]|uniref:YceI family protein n=1 Tax=Algivirga pacifica TaxID=1162670 RepID=A0ABP9DJM3_9BACT